MRNGVCVGAAALVAAVAAVAPAAAAGPPAAIVRAEAKTARASSLRFTISIATSAGGRRAVVRGGGVERPRAHQAALALDYSRLDPQLGRMQILVVGSRSYVHYGLLDGLRAKQPQIRPWVATDAASSLGLDPWSLTGDPSALSGLRAAGGGTVGGVRVTRFVGTIDVAGVLATNPQLKQLVGQLGSSVTSLLARPVPVELDVGADGYIHRFVERLSLPAAGQAPLAVDFEFDMSAFGADTTPIAAPPPSQVMSQGDFDRLATAGQLSTTG